MNRHVFGALFEDAFRQVLDDKVFRLLVVLALILIVPTFLIGFRPEGISLLFGWKTWSYDDLLRAFGGGGNMDVDDVHIAVISGVQELIVQGLAGTVGLLFCIAATAFFVPRMLEKGAADTLFSKPVGRFTLLLARYAAGVLFVGCLSFLLVLGMHLGFLVGSGHSDPAFLWSALTLTYVFALVHAMSVLVAVLTRSSIAAILTTLIFFVFNGCIHKGWIQVQHKQAVDAEARARGEEDAPTESNFGFLIDTLDAMHWVLPKTTDADYVVAGLRRSLTEKPAALRDANEYVSVVGIPDGFAREGGVVVDLAQDPATWIARDAESKERARLTISRRTRRDPSADGKLRSPSWFAAEFSKATEKDAATSEKPTRGGRPRTDAFDVAWVRWRSRGESAETHRARGFLAVDDALYEIDTAFQPFYGTNDERDDVLKSLLAEVRIDKRGADTQSPEVWYGRQFGWASPWRFNAFVSISSSVGLAVLLLFIARWRLQRIDF